MAGLILQGIMILVLAAIWNELIVLRSRVTPHSPMNADEREVYTPDERESVEDYQVPLDVDEFLSVNEKVLLREKEYDFRIAQMKDRLAAQTPTPRPNQRPAEELHPDVKNLPHNIIDAKGEDLPDVEDTE